MDIASTIDRDIEVKPLRRAFAGHVLWGFDEVRERHRFGQVERRLLELEVELFNDFGTQFAPGSRDCVRRLFVACPSVRTPSISAQPDGQLICTWTTTHGERLSIRCASGHRLQYAIIDRGDVPAVRTLGDVNEPATFWDRVPEAREIAEGD